MEKNSYSEESKSDIDFLYRSIIPFPKLIVLGLVFFGANMFGFYESQLLNTYIIQVLDTPNKYNEVAFMVASSAVMGLIFLFVFGVYSDNARSKYGRRKPFILAGGIVGGIAMVLYGFSPNFAWCWVLDVIAMGLASNCYYAAQRVIVADLVDIEHRGRANSLISAIGLIGYLAAVLLSVVLEPKFPKQLGDETVMNQTGHIVLLSLGGIIIIVASLLGFFFIEEPNVEGIPKKTFGQELTGLLNIQELKKHVDFFKLALAMLVFNIGMQLVLPFIFDFIFRLGTDNVIKVLAIAAPFLVVFIFVSGKLIDTIGRRKVIPPIIIISSIGYVLVPIGVRDGSINFGITAIGFTLVLIGLLGVSIPLLTWTQDLLPDDQRGKFSGLNNITNTLNQVIGVAIGGALLTYYSGADGDANAFEMAKIFPWVLIFNLGSIPIFLTVKETLKKDSVVDIKTSAELGKIVETTKTTPSENIDTMKMLEPDDDKS